jgi:hypothetical protein
MTQDEIIEMANKASKEWLKEFPSPEETANQVPKRFLEIFAKLIAAKEREACAKVCFELPAPDIYSNTDKSMWGVTCIDCATAIRARGQGTPERGQA